MTEFSKLISNTPSTSYRTINDTMMMNVIRSRRTIIGRESYCSTDIRRREGSSYLFRSRKTIAIVVKPEQEQQHQSAVTFTVQNNSRSTCTSIIISSTNANANTNTKRYYPSYCYCRKRTRTSSLLGIFNTDTVTHRTASRKSSFSSLSYSSTRTSQDAVVIAAKDKNNNDHDHDPPHITLEHMTKYIQKQDDGTSKEVELSSGTDVANILPITISVITLNRPTFGNAISIRMITELQQIIKEIQLQFDPPYDYTLHPTMQIESNVTTTTTTSSTTTPRCIVLRSSTPKVFCTGADLKERATKLPTLQDVSNFVTTLRTTFHTFSILPIPIIAAIDGYCLGGGLELALCADIRLAGIDVDVVHDDTTYQQQQPPQPPKIFGFPEVTLGIIPGAGGTQRIIQQIGGNVGLLKKLIYTGQRFTAQQAYEYGIVQELVSNTTSYTVGSGSGVTSTATTNVDDINNHVSPTVTAAMNMAWYIAQNCAPIAIQSAKYAIHHGYHSGHASGNSSTSQTMEAALHIEQQAYERVLYTQDRNEGLLAFQQKRKPYYKGY